jgi:hypothetical protein
MGTTNRPYGGSVNRPGRAGFTNRLSITEPVPEEIEMNTKSTPDSPSASSGSGKGKAVSFDGDHESFVGSPTTPTSRQGGESMYGSTVDLTPKSKRDEFARGTAF